VTKNNEVERYVNHQKNWGVVLFFALMLISRSSFADWYIVPTGSMLPTIVEGDRIFVNKMAYRLEIPFTNIELMQTGEPNRGDIVVFNSEKAGVRMVKRLIGLPGDKVAMHNNQLSINGKPLVYSELDETNKGTEKIANVAHKLQFVGAAQADTFNEVIVPHEHYLVLGDNRNNSADSRYYGFIPAKELQGRAIEVIISLDESNYYLPRKKRFFTPLI
jgi:signal peptidase I